MCWPDRADSLYLPRAQRCLNPSAQPPTESGVGTRNVAGPGVVRELNSAGRVLLQPELLDAYASAMVNMAKEEPDGLRSLAEESALTGKFFVPKEQNVTHPGQEQLVVHAMVEELARYDLALRENADDGRYLIFPSQFNRDYEDAPEPKGKQRSPSTGRARSPYSTLAVRLGHSVS